MDMNVITQLISNEELSSYLLAIAFMCTSNNTDNCDMTITTIKGNKIKFHIEIEEVK